MPFEPHVLHRIQEIIRDEYVDVQELIEIYRNHLNLFLILFRGSDGIPSVYHIAECAIRTEDTRMLIEVSRMTQELLQQGTLTQKSLIKNIEPPDENSYGLLQLLAKIGNLEVFQFWFEHSSQDQKNAEYSSLGFTECKMTLATIAAMHNRLEILKYLALQGTNINAPSSTGHTPFYWFNPYVKTLPITAAKFLIENGGDVNGVAKNSDAIRLLLEDYWVSMKPIYARLYTVQAMTLLLEYKASLTFLKPEQLEKLRLTLNQLIKDPRYRAWRAEFFYLQGLIEESLIPEDEFFNLPEPIYLDAVEACHDLGKLGICMRVAKHCYQNDLKHVAKIAYERCAQILEPHVGELKNYRVLVESDAIIDLDIITKETGVKNAIVIVDNFGLNSAVLLANGMVEQASRNKKSNERRVFVALMGTLLAIPVFSQLTAKNRQTLAHLIPRYAAIMKIPNQNLMKMSETLLRSEIKSEEDFLDFVTLKAANDIKESGIVIDCALKLPENKEEWQQFALSMADECKKQENKNKRDEWRELAEMAEEKISYAQSPHGMFSASCPTIIDLEVYDALQDQLDVLSRWCRGASSGGVTKVDEIMRFVQGKIAYFLHEKNIQFLADLNNRVAEMSANQPLLKIPEPVNEILRLVNKLIPNQMTVQKRSGLEM